MTGSCYLTGVEHDLASNSNNAVASMHKNLMLLESVAQAKLEAAHLPMLAWAIRTPSTWLYVGPCVHVLT